MDTKVKKKLPGHWYRITFRDCVICGAGTEHRERIYGEKPKYYTETHLFYECVCDSHFM